MKESFITFLSQSGETIDLLESVRALQSEQVGFGAIVNRLGSSLERSTPIKIMLGAGPEQCVLATKSFTAKLATTFLLAHARSNSIDQGKTELAATVQEAKRVLSDEYTQRRILPLAESIKESAHLFILGRGMSYPVALEAALKIKEVTYIHTEGFAAGELKHGVIALIEQGTPSIVFAPADETHDAMISTAMEIKSRGAYVIGVSDQPNEVFDYHLPLRTTGLSSAITQSIVIQLLAHQLALLLGRDPDKPRNLAKSVTVK